MNYMSCGIKLVFFFNISGVMKGIEICGNNYRFLDILFHSKGIMKIARRGENASVPFLVIVRS